MRRIKKIKERKSIIEKLKLKMTIKKNYYLIDLICRRGQNNL
jgi:hypothetical protein